MTTTQPEICATCDWKATCKYIQYNDELLCPAVKRAAREREEQEQEQPKEAEQLCLAFA